MIYEFSRDAWLLLIEPWLLVNIHIQHINKLHTNFIIMCTFFFFWLSHLHSRDNNNLLILMFLLHSHYRANNHLESVDKLLFGVELRSSSIYFVFCYAVVVVWVVVFMSLCILLSLLSGTWEIVMSWKKWPRIIFSNNCLSLKLYNWWVN